MGFASIVCVLLSKSSQALISFSIVLAILLSDVGIPIQSRMVLEAARCTAAGLLKGRPWEALSRLKSRGSV
jgi:hypothetical protein